MNKRKDVPFFARYLEGQHPLRVKTDLKAGQTLKYPSDLDEAHTLKYPSDQEDS